MYFAMFFTFKYVQMFTMKKKLYSISKPSNFQGTLILKSNMFEQTSQIKQSTTMAAFLFLLIGQLWCPSADLIKFISLQ